MFVQIIRGHTAQPEALRRHLEKWEEELEPGAPGWLGVTEGVTDDGEFIALARFESEEAARQNSGRPEQDEWYREMVSLLDGDPTFVDSTDVELMLGGGSDDAHFVQVMEVKPTDPQVYRDLTKQGEDVIPEMRPELLGAIQVWHPGGDRCTEFIYFTSEDEARRGEGQEMTSDVQEMMEQWHAAEGEVVYLDLREPLVHSAR
ncbi:MAG TPA: hypothetical protein VM618_08460 [Acidimicrobiia bacterium]|nr:hypothetical protein [Acidimicrobiia bacterium]